VNEAKVFEEPSVPREGPLRNSEPGVNWYIQSTRPEAVGDRRAVNEWYSHFLDNGTALLSRLRSTDDVNHHQAVDELLVHHLLLRGSIAVAYEESGRSPDFRLYVGGDYIGGVEVASLFMRNDWSKEESRNGKLADQLNARLPVGEWFVNFEIIRWNRSPSVRKLVSWVAKTVGELPPWDPSSGSTGLPSALYTNGAVEISFYFLPRRAGGPVGPDYRIVGISGVLGGWVNSKDRLGTVLTAKAGSRYDLRGRPFAVFVSIHDTFCDEDDLVGALYGSEQVVVATGASIRARDGIFGNSRAFPEGRNRRLSCVFAVMPGWSSRSADGLAVLRLDNPFADSPFPEGILPPARRFTEVSRDERGISFGWTACSPEPQGS